MQPPGGGNYDDLFAVIAALFHTMYAGLKPEKIRITYATEDGKNGKLTIPIPTGRTRPEPTEAEERVINAIGEGLLNGPQIAAVLGDPYDGNLRGLLSAMVVSSLLRKMPKGYVVAE